MLSRINACQLPRETAPFCMSPTHTNNTYNDCAALTCPNQYENCPEHRFERSSCAELVPLQHHEGFRARALEWRTDDARNMSCNHGCWCAPRDPLLSFLLVLSRPPPNPSPDPPNPPQCPKSLRPGRSRRRSDTSRRRSRRPKQFGHKTE